MKTLFNFIFVLLSLIGLLSCDSNEPQTASILSLTVEDVSCTEAWLQLKIANIQLPINIILLLNGSLNKRFTISTQDSLIYFDSLLPKQNYKFKVVAIVPDLPQPATSEVFTQTMDTTSHNFTWQIFTFGEHSSSTLYDVAIINENDIWAVGEIYMKDSLGNPDPICYNALHWNGQSWELIKTGGYGGYPRRTVFAFSANDVWFDGVIKWDGLSYSVHMDGWPLMPNGDGWQVNKMWGHSSNDFYAVGSSGSIAHYKNGSWTKIESGTTTNINDAWGITENEISTIYCPVSSIFNPPQDKKILKITESKVDLISWNKDKILYGCWTNSNKYLYVCGSGVYNNKSGQWHQEDLPAISMNRIRGNALNDIFLIGDFGFASHFNGINWQIYNENFGDIWALSFKQDIVSFVGQKNGYGYIVIGKR